MQPYIFIRIDGRNVRFRLTEIVYMEALGNYTRIVTDSRQWLALMAILQMEQLLPEKDFCRVHRSYIVSLDKMDSFDRDRIYLHKREMTIPIGNAFRKELERRIVLITSEVQRLSAGDIVPDILHRDA